MNIFMKCMAFWLAVMLLVSVSPHDGVAQLPPEAEPIVAEIEIVNPENNLDYDVSEENFTTTPPIQFQARVLPQELNWQGEIQWTLNMEYDTTRSRGAWTNQRTFYTQNDMIHEELFASVGGKVIVTASASLSDGNVLTKQIEFTVTGIDIPDNVITAQLTSAYSGATSNLLTGIAAVETEGDYDQFRNFSKYGIATLWPNESKSDDGSHIGLMQVAIREAGETSINARIGAAWNWLTNLLTNT